MANSQIFFLPLSVSGSVPTSKDVAGATHAAAIVFKEESFASRTIGCLLDEPRGRRNFCRRVPDVVQEHDGFRQAAEDEAARVPSVWGYGAAK